MGKEEREVVAKIDTVLECRVKKGDGLKSDPQKRQFFKHYMRKYTGIFSFCLLLSWAHPSFIKFLSSMAFSNWTYWTCMPISQKFCDNVGSWMFVPSILTENIIQICLQIYVATKIDENEDNSIVKISLFGSVLQVMWNLLNCLVTNILRSEGENMSHKSDLLYKKYDKCVHESISKMQLIMAPTASSLTATTSTVIISTAITDGESTVIELRKEAGGDNSSTHVKSENSGMDVISENLATHVSSERL